MNAPDGLIDEQAVLDRWPALSRSKLRAARKSKRVGWVCGKRGYAWYRPSAIEEFIRKELEKPCLAQEPTPSSSLEGNGLPTNTEQKSSTDSGLSQEQEELVAQRLVQKIFRKP